MIFYAKIFLIASRKIE